MSLLSSWFGKQKGIDYWEEPGYESKSIGNIDIPVKLSNDNAFFLASTVTEIYNPIDFYADRGSKLRYFIADKDGNELENSEYKRFITDINPLYSFNDLIYQYIFSYMSDGNGITLVTVPSNYKKPSANSITRLDVLQPDLLQLDEYNNISLLNISSFNELIKSAKYNEMTSHYVVLEIPKLRFDHIDQTRRTDSLVLCQSPLFKAVRPVNNLLATYSARYNVYANNGAAGYLVKKQSNQNNINEIVDPTTRQNILDDINERNGITGRRNFWGISSVPLEFINTLAHIKDLMPFEETLNDAIAISSVYQLQRELVMGAESTTFNNKAEAERSVWENGLMSMVETATYNLTRALYLDKVGVQIKADYSSVSALSENEIENQDLISKKLANLKALKELQPDNKEIDKQIELIIQGYGQA